MSFYSELKRRNVFRVGAAYVVTSWLIVQVVDTVFPIYGLPETAIRSIVTLLVIGLLPVLILAWAFELTPEGFKRDRDVDRTSATAGKAAKRLDRGIIVMLALALSYFAFDRFVLVPEMTAEKVEAARQAGISEALVESYGELSIAVLAFEDRSPMNDQEYLSEGIADEILNLLANIPELRVISRKSSFSYKGKEVPIRTIAEQLDVAHVLDGSVRVAGDRIRITAHLIDARSDTQVWSQSFDRTLDDIFGIQEEVAGAIVDELKPTMLSSASRRERIGSDAYFLYLQAKFYKDRGKPDAVKLLEQVVTMEPNFADAWAELADSYLRRAPTFGRRDHANDTNWQKGNQAVEKLSAIDPGHPVVSLSTAWWSMESKDNYIEAARILERAIEQHPNHEYLLRVAAIFAGMIREDSLAIAMSGKVVRLNPLCAQCAYRYSLILINGGRFADAEKAILKFRDLVPGDGGGLTLGKARLLRGDIAGAIAAFNQRSDEPGRRYGSLLVQLTVDPDADMSAQIAEFAREDNYLNPLASVELYAMRGEHDLAFQLLHPVAESSANWDLAHLLRSPFLENLRSDPRWMELQETVGITPHQLRDIDFNPQL